ncbi:MAG: hypothetical protein AAGB13_05280 [Cyanobacteria bacterium P01_F01_bin.33]
MFGFPEILLAQLVMFGFSFHWMLKRNDEIPLLINSCMLYIGAYPYWAVQQGWRGWINLSTYGLEPVTNETALTALNCIILGQICLNIAYCWRQNLTLPVAVPPKADALMQQVTPAVMVAGALCLPLVILTRGVVSSQRQGGMSLAFQVSGYLSSFPLVMVGIATLVLCLWRMGALRSMLFKILAIAILIGVANMSFNISGRFQFLGIIATGGVIFSSTYKPRTRLWILIGAALIGASMFAIAGVMRTPVADELVNEYAFYRFFGAEDANMIDGMATLRDAMPRLVGYRWGMAHIEVLLRPIPRSLWPGKPIGGGYLATVGLIDVESGTTLGFAPTMFGDFYSEAGIFGIIALSFVYGSVLAAIVRFSTRLKPFASVMVRAMLCASLVPLLRGGDLAGIYAGIGMSFWPCLLLLIVKRKELLAIVPRRLFRSPMPIYPDVLPPGTRPPGMPPPGALPPHLDPRSPQHPSHRH